MLDAVLNVAVSGWGSTILLAILGAFLGAGFKKYKNAVKEITDIGIKYRQVTSEKSLGGKSMTDREKDEFIKEIVEAIEAIVPLIPGRKST